MTTATSSAYSAGGGWGPILRLHACVVLLLSEGWPPLEMPAEIHWRPTRRGAGPNERGLEWCEPRPGTIVFLWAFTKHRTPLGRYEASPAVAATAECS